MNNLRGKKITITGGDGFLGTHLKHKFWKHKIDAKPIDIKDVNLLNQQLTFDWFDANRPDIIIHLAADVGGIGYNEKNPGKLFYNNMAMGLNVIEACRVFAVKKLVVTGTVCGYPKFTKVPFKEDTLWDGYPEETNAPYGVAKRGILLLMQSYRKQYGLNGIYLLIVNMYGEYDHFEGDDNHVIPAMIRKFIEAKNENEPFVNLWGSGKATREFLYAGDAAEAIFKATARYDKPMPINVGAGFEISIEELAYKISSLIGYDGRITFNLNRPDGQPRRCLDVSKAKEYFQFASTISIDEGLKRTIDWYKGTQ